MGSGGSKSQPKPENVTNNSRPPPTDSSQATGSDPKSGSKQQDSQKQQPQQDPQQQLSQESQKQQKPQQQQEPKTDQQQQQQQQKSQQQEPKTDQQQQQIPPADVKLPTMSNSESNTAGGPGKGDNEENKEIKVPVVEQALIPEEPPDQKKFDCALKSACLLVKPDSILTLATKNVTTLHLRRALPHHFSLEKLLNKFVGLSELDLSNNNLGPQGFRALCLAMCGNSTILSLNLADNKSDTDSADCLGKMLEENKTLQYLDVSSNYLGKDYFSRKVGPALKVNTALQTLRCESIGTTDARLLIEGLQENSTLVELDISRNEISDTVGFAKGLAQCLKRDGSTLTTLCLMRCGFNSASITEMIKGLANNTSLEELNLCGSEFDSLGVMYNLTVAAARHPSLRNLSLDNATVKSPDITTELAQSSFQATDYFLTCIRAEGQGSSLRKVSYGLNKAEEIPQVLMNSQLHNLNYLSVRMCKISADSVGQFAKCWENPSCSLTTLVLDGLKLSATSALGTLLANPKTCKLTTLSLGGCQFDDNDLSPLVESLKGGLPLQMLKLSANRITDVGVANLTEGLLKNKAAQILVLDLSNNRMTNDGVKSLTKLFGSKSKLSSLNVSANNIGKEGMVMLAGLFGPKSPLQTLHTQGQTPGLDEPHMIEIYNKLAASLGYKFQMDGDQVKPGCSDLPGNLPDRLLVNFTSMGGQTGSIGQALDSRCILTDQPGEKLPYLSLDDVFTICCYLKGQKEATCVWSEKEWDMITGADRATTDAPSWLKLPDARNRCIYMGNLPGTTTQQKVDAILEMEADCNLEEACLMKDPVTRSVNGCGWALMADTESIQKALDLFNSGEAKIFGQPFLISRVKVNIDNEANSQLEKTASADLQMRLQLKAKEEASHRKLIVTTTEASWKRHAYRLAHPAYADGRIW